jgi:hypothetical protein
MAATPSEESPGLNRGPVARRRDGLKWVNRPLTESKLAFLIATNSARRL